MYQWHSWHCFENSNPGNFPLADTPLIVLHILTACNLDPRDLAKLEATCTFFRQPANFAPGFDLSISELAALDMCRKRALFNTMNEEECRAMRRRCGSSWKLVLKFLLAGEACCRRGKPQGIAGPGHSIVVTSKGVVYSFGANDLGQLGNENTEDSWQPRPIRSLQGIRIIQAAAGSKRTLLVSEAGRAYAFGKTLFGEPEQGLLGQEFITTPQLVGSLKNIFVVQVVVGNFFTAVLCREGRVYTFAWGDNERLGHGADRSSMVPYPLLGALEDIPVVQIAAGYCYLLALAYQPNGMSVYSVGCGLGGKLGHGSKTDEKFPRLIEEFQALDFQPTAISAGAWHAAVVGRDGRVCTWGWGNFGCLGHGDEESRTVPTVVEALKGLKAVHVAAGAYTTFVSLDNGDVYSFGWNDSANLGQGDGDANVSTPKLVTSLKQTNERVVQISVTNSVEWDSHTFALTESGKLFGFGAGESGQLGLQLGNSEDERAEPERIDIDLS